jgi:hypothetical protein
MRAPNLGKIVVSLSVVPVSFMRLEPYVTLSLEVLESCVQPPVFDTYLGPLRGTRVLATQNPDTLRENPSFPPPSPIIPTSPTAIASVSHQAKPGQCWRRRSLLSSPLVGCAEHFY